MFALREQYGHDESHGTQNQELLSWQQPTQHESNYQNNITTYLILVLKLLPNCREQFT